MRYNFDEYFESTNTALQDYLGKNSNLSELTKDMLDFYDESLWEQARYEYDEKVRWNSYLPDTIQELKRIKLQERERQTDQPGFFKIGTVDLSIPPIQISVNDIKNNYTYQTLRSNSDMTFSSGHTSKIIEMDVYFNGIDEINDKLIPLLAQLKATPFTPMKNDYIRRIIFPESNNITFVDEDGKESTLAQATLDVEAKKSKAKSDMIVEAKNVSEDFALDVKKYLNGEKGNFDLKKSLSKNVKESTYERRNNTKIARATSKTIAAAEATEKELQHLNELYSSQFSKMTPNDINDITLAGVLSQMTVSTVQGFPESLLCHFTFFVFNYSPFSQKFDFIRWNNAPTNSIDECEYFIKWYSDRFLSNKSDSYMEKLNEALTGEVKFTFEATPLDEEGKKDPKTKANYFELKTDEKNVCSSITISNRNNIAFMPVLAWSMPTCQYLGRSSSEVLLSFDVLEDEFMEKMRFLTEVIDLVSRTNTDKGRRKNFVSVDNEILRLNGLKNCVIQSMETTTVPGSPGLTRINLKMIEFNIKQLEAEIITLAEGPTRERLIALFDVEMNNLINKRAALLRRGEKNLPTQFTDFPVADGLNEACMVFEGGNISGQEFNALGDPRVMRNFKAIAAAEGNVKISNKVANSLDLFVRAKPGQIGSTAQEIASEVGQRGLISAAGTFLGLGAFKPFIDRIPISQYSIGERGDLGYFHEVKQKKNGEDVTYNNTERKKLRNSIASKMYDPAKGITDDAKVSIMNSDAFKTWLKRKEKQIINYIEGRQPPTDETALSPQEIDSLKKKELDKYQNKSHVLYPDMELPIYDDIPALEKPSYDTLGISPPRLLGRDLSPRLGSDIVEPDFYFNNLKLKKYKGTAITWEKEKQLSWDEIARNAIQDIGGFFSGVGDSVDKLLQDEIKYAGDHDAFAAISTSKQIDDVDKEGNYQYNNLRGLEARNLEYEAGKGDLLDGVGLYTVLDGNSMGYYGNVSEHTSAMQKENAARFDINSAYHAEELRKNIVESIKDDTKRMVRAFPTFRLYFVEEDAGSWGLFDDFYGYNSIESIEIHKSKDNAADTAVIKVTNFLGHLDNKNFENSKHGRGAKEKFNIQTGEMEDPQIEDMYLYPGTQIQIKLGHSSNESELSNVFTGKITEVSHGDVITFVAQGYGVELLQPKGYDWNKSKYGGFPFAWKADPLNIMNMLVSSSEVKHFGRWGFNTLDQGEILGWRVKGKWVPLWNRPQDDNIYLQKENRSNLLIRLFGFFNEYRIYQRTAWDVFQDMRRRFPGYAVAAVPYDGRATLFFGLPNQLYNYTSGKGGSSRRTDTTRYLEDKSKLEKTMYKPMLQSANRLPLRINQGLWDDLYENASKRTREESESHPARAAKDVWENASRKISSGTFDQEDAQAIVATFDNLEIDPDKSALARPNSTIKFQEYFKKKITEDPKNINLFKVSVFYNANGASVDISPAGDIDETVAGVMVKSDNALYQDSLGNIKTRRELEREFPLALGQDPRWKTFRKYHFKDSFHHIIANNIKIDLNNFYNRIVVEFYGDIGGATIIDQKKASRNYFELLADDSIPPDYWKTKVVFEENAERYYQARNYALGNLLQTTAKLYDGELVMLGDAEIKPYDFVYINDSYTNMYGPVEVAEVVHRFTRETGFMTTVIPELVVHVNNPSSVSDTWLAQTATLGMAGLAAAAVTAAVMSGLVATIAVGSILMIPSVRDTIFPAIFGKLGFSAEIREPIGITPLIYNGKPYVAGFEGMRSESYIVSLTNRVVKYIEDFGTGISIANFMILNSMRGE